MGLKCLVSARVVGTDAALAVNNALNILIYTAPGGGAVIKELIYFGWGSSTASQTIQLYVLKAGAVDVPQGASVISVGDTDPANTHVAMALFANPTVPNSLAFTRLATTLVLGPGDQLKLRYVNGTAGTINTTTRGIMLWASGVEG